MALVTTFNTLLVDFVQELEETFPTEKAFSGLRSKIQLAASIDPQALVGHFVDNMAPHMPRVQQEDESLFSDPRVDLFKGVSLAASWEAATPGTKKAIFQHLQNLYLVGSAIRGIPASVLSSIETIAERCTRDMDLQQAVGDGAGTQAGIMDAVGKVMAGIMRDPDMMSALLPPPSRDDSKTG